MSKHRILSVSVFLISLSCFAFAQTDFGDSILWFHPNQEIRVTNLPSLPKPSTDPNSVLGAAIQIALRDKAVCCGKGSALEQGVLAAPMSLKELSAKLQGRHFLRDGRPIVVSADYVPQSSINSGLIVGALLEQRTPLIEWNSHVYVLYGAIFNETRFTSGMRQYAILKLLLLDPRFSDQRREIFFDRETDDWETVRGLLTLAVAPQ